MTGTPAGVAEGMPGQPWLQAGDHVVVEIDKIGSLEVYATAMRRCKMCHHRKIDGFVEVHALAPQVDIVSDSSMAQCFANIAKL